MNKYGGDEFDRNNVKNIYRTKPGGKELYQPSISWTEWRDPKGTYTDRQIGWEEERYKKRTYRSGGWSRGTQYQFTKTQEFVNQEVTAYVKVPRYDGRTCGKGTGFSTKTRGGKHENALNSAGCYIFHHPYLGGDCGNFGKEKPHPKYNYSNIKPEFEGKSMLGRWIGVKAIIWNEARGVNCEMWLDYGGIDNDNNSPKNEWELWYFIKDTGQYGQGATKPPFSRPNGSVTQFRLDGVWKPVATGDADADTGLGCNIRYASIRQLENPPVKVKSKRSTPDEEVDDCW